MLEEGKFVADRYEILAKIGAGGMSDVYKAMDHVLSRYVAVKVLKQEYGEDVNFVTKFRSEAQAAAGLEHPNIVNIYDVGSEDGIHYIVMEYVEGITLKTYIEKKYQLSYKEAISIAIQVGRGIEAAHNKNIVHRDIKPQNIIISTEGKVKVTDFGIARAATSNTIHSDVMGSVHYASPEQARNGFVDGKSDIYSLGIVMYEMVTGRVPFDGDTTVAIAIQHLQEEMVSPRSYVPDLPVSLEKIILRCTQKSADRRYPDIGALLEDLKHALVSPDEDFVKMLTPASVQGKTRVISEAEVNQIKEETAGIHLNSRELEPEHQEQWQEDSEEDEGGLLNPRMEKAMTIMGIIAAVIILIIIIYLAGSMLDIFKFPFSGSNNKDPLNEFTTSDREELSDADTDTDTDTDAGAEGEVKMISLLGQELADAQKALTKLGLKLYSLGTEHSDQYPEGQIISQDIKEGESVEKGTMVKVTVSSGAEPISLPNVVGYTESQAVSMLQAAELKVSTDSRNDNTVEAGIVIEQSPVGGTQVHKGETVSIVVSQGKERVTVPDLRNQKEEKAGALLAEKGLEIGSTDSEYHDTVPEGQIISQVPNPGESVYAGSQVDYVVSLGKKEVFYELTDEQIDVPDNDAVVSANIQLLDANGQVLDSWANIDVSSFPYYISCSGITTSSGTISIEWILDDETTTTESRKIEFSQQ